MGDLKIQNGRIDVKGAKNVTNTYFLSPWKC